tara:strand:+ start:2008 stop:2730 length:723 start_codon:yes stop_codon:yes gene_type:complete
MVTIMEDQAAIETTSDTLLTEAIPEVSEGAYFLTEDVKGTGETPEWFNSNKYKSVADQAKGYAELEKKFGGFKGTPKDGYMHPEGIENDDVLLQELITFADDTNMSQEAFGRAWELLSAQDNAVQEVSQEEEVAKLGDNAQDRINNVEGFMKNNLDAESYEQAKNLVTTADTIQLVEMLVKATAPSRLPTENDHVPVGLTKETIEAEMFKKDDNGNLLRSTNIDHERKIQKMWQDWGNAQ